MSIKMKITFQLAVNIIMLDLREFTHVMMKVHYFTEEFIFLCGSQNIFRG